MNERTTDGAAPAIRLPEARDRSYTPSHGAQGGAMTGVEAERRAGSARTRREPLAGADRIQVAMFAGLVTMFAAVLGAGALGFTAISGQLLDLQKQIGGMQTEIGGMQTGISGMQTEIGAVQTGIGELRTEIGELRTEMHEQIGELRTEMHEQIGELRTEMHEQIGNLSTEMHDEIGELSERMARVETLIQTRLVPQTPAPTPAGS